MSRKSESLRLLVVDESPAIADELTDLLKTQGIPTRIQILDDREELEKAFRHTWDIILFISGYDISYEDVMRQIQSHGLDLPVILLLNDHATFDLNQKESANSSFFKAYTLGVSDVLPTSRPLLLIQSIRRELRNLEHRRNERNLELLLGDAERRSQLFLKNSKTAVSYIDEGVHIFANESYLELFGYESLDELIGMPVIDLVDSKDLMEFKDFLKVYTKTGRNVADFNFCGVCADGSRFEATLQIGPASFEGEPCIQMIIQHQAKANTQLLEAQLAAIERLDGLTNLGNRRAFEEALEATRDTAIKFKQQYALLFTSIDNIGQISASTGLAGSDATVQKVAEILSSQFSNAQNYRFGDSTFATLVPNTSPESISAYAQATTEQISKSLISIGNRTIQTTVSIGIAMIGETSPNATELLSRAFNSADKVKLQNHGIGNGINLYNPAENASQSDQALRELLEEALEKGNFKLMFQSIYDTRNDANPLFEVYARLPLADGKIMQPDEFMPVAHRYGMESRLDRWILLNACKRLKGQLVAHPGTRLLINLSSDSLQDTSLPLLVSKLTAAIGGAENKPLILQFNESDATNYLKLARDNIHAFREKGCQVSINNFGSSMNSMSLLNHLEIDLVKIDKSFVQDLSNEENVQAVKKITADVTTHGSQVMIAYIENPTAMSKAWSMGARYLQGYYLQMPSEDMVFEG
ncbi:EAL domain-containing protein [Aquirhabdus sp.]|uniref:GGDEF/EAL domain-containing response regulator n=1 Tax=Aquirhabdus sp. TaxID=2824160 RepID=UPI00396CB2A7